MGAADASRERGEAASNGKLPLDFSAQFQASYRVLWLVAAGIVGDPNAAEDVVQEAALLALGKLDQFQPGTNFRAWMAQMVRYVALNHARKRHKQRAAPLDSVGESSFAGKSSLLPEARLTAKGDLPADQTYFDDQIMTALNSVHPIARSCLLLRTLSQMEYS